MSAQKKNKFIYWFSEIGKDDISLVGGKGANLGEMYNLGIPVPPGFIVSSSAYFHFIEVNNLKKLSKAKGNIINKVGDVASGKNIAGGTYIAADKTGKIQGYADKAKDAHGRIFN